MDKGWHHTHHQQWAENNFQNLEFDTTTQQFQFSKNILSVVADAMVLSPTNNSFTRFLLNGIRIYRGPFANGANLGAVVLDPVTGQQITYNSATVFNTQVPTGRQALIELIRDSIPSGHYVTILSFQTNPNNTYLPEEWAADSIDLGVNLFQILENEGATRVRELETLGAVPYAFAFIKGEGAIQESIGANGEEVVSVLFGLPTVWDQGRVISEPIGPADQWGELR